MDSEHWERTFLRLFVRADVSEWKRAIEIGPGSGKYTKKVLGASSAVVRAYDVSEKFLSVCQTRLKSDGDESRLKLKLLSGGSS
jgi:16S rRNA A1518/A1519 N6-dimethyltransferase RsmA/KsgA/DIM1 with predicted DNA glycosylase/AP lyase activity